MNSHSRSRLLQVGLALGVERFADVEAAELGQSGAQLDQPPIDADAVDFPVPLNLGGKRRPAQDRHAVGRLDDELATALLRVLQVQGRTHARCKTLAADCTRLVLRPDLPRDLLRPLLTDDRLQRPAALQATSPKGANPFAGREIAYCPTVEAFSDRRPTSLHKLSDLLHVAPLSWVKESHLQSGHPSAALPQAETLKNRSATGWPADNRCQGILTRFGADLRGRSGTSQPKAGWLVLMKGYLTVPIVKPPGDGGFAVPGLEG